MRMMRWVFAGALVTGMAVLVQGEVVGQQPGAKGGRGGQPGQPGAKGGFGQPGGGFGGFGGAGGLGGFGGLGGLMNQVTTNKDLQAELKVDEATVEKIKGLREARQAELQKLIAKFNEDSQKEYDAALTPAQRTRLKQIEIQNQGLRAFTTAETVKPLNLTEAQTTKIKAIVDDTQKTIGEARRELFGAGGGMGGFGRIDPEKQAEVNKKVQKLEKTAMADISDLLTGDQRKTWETMVGEPFDTTKLRQGFGGFGGAGGGTRPTPKKD